MEQTNSFYNGKTLLICGFPGIGKSFIKDELRYPVFDSDSSKFSKTNFPQNYVSKIKDTISKYPTSEIILVSTHEVVRKELREQGLEYILVYPKKESLQDYLVRYYNRGSSTSFIDLVKKNWNKFIESCEEDPSNTHYCLNGNQYLSDIFKEIIQKGI